MLRREFVVVSKIMIQWTSYTACVKLSIGIWEAKNSNSKKHRFRNEWCFYIFIFFFSCWSWVVCATQANQQWRWKTSTAYARIWFLFLCSCCSCHVPCCLHRVFAADVLPMCCLLGKHDRNDFRVLRNCSCVVNEKELLVAAAWFVGLLCCCCLVMINGNTYMRERNECEKIDSLDFVVSNRSRVESGYLPCLMDAWYSVCKNFNKYTLSNAIPIRNNTSRKSQRRRKKKWRQFWYYKIR